MISTTELKQFVDQSPEVRKLLQLLNESLPCWIVGGCLRDLILKRPINDIDVASHGDPTRLARSFAKIVHGHWFWLDEGRRQSRVLLQSGRTFDFAPLRADGIAADLALRDYTINALAISLKFPLENQRILDPLGGMTHLQAKELHSCSTSSFPDDPLRMLKGIRHCVTLDLNPGRETLQQMRDHAVLIVSVAGERCREELWQILAAHDIEKSLDLLFDTGLLAEIFGKPAGEIDSSEIVVRMVDFKKRLTPAVESFQSLREAGAGEVPLLIGRLVALYQPLDLPGLLRIRLRLSKNEQRLLQQLQIPVDQAMLELAEKANTLRRKALVFEALGPFALERLIFLKCLHSPISEELINALFLAYGQLQHCGRIPDLLSGQELTDHFEPSAKEKIGKAQKMIKHAEMIQEIESREDAFQWLEKQNI